MTLSPLLSSAVPSRSPESCAQGLLLRRVLQVLERSGIACCLLHGYRNYDAGIKGDVDCLMPGQFLPHRLARVLHDNADELGARAVYWFADDSHVVSLAGRDEDGAPVILQLHVSHRYEMAGRVFFKSGQILASRRRFNGLPVPAVDIEFACILINRITKQDLTAEHGRRLQELFADDSHGCAAQIERLLRPGSAGLVLAAVGSGQWDAVSAATGRLREELLRGPASHPGGGQLRSWQRRVSRWMRPQSGYHVVFLGPDGVGKSTVIETFQGLMGQVFLSTSYQTFAPGLLPQKFAPEKPGGPHSLEPRSLPASLLKVAWWLVCYTAGYLLTVRPVLARGGIVVNHRYLVDAVVDRKRYRYSGPAGLLEMIWRVSPKPDLVFLLDAPADVIQRRKQEVAPEETARQVAAYRAAIGKLPMGIIVDAARSRERVATEVAWNVLDRLARRVSRRFHLEDNA